MPTSDEWECFRLYAQHVRTLSVYTENISVLREVLRHGPIPTQCLFPETEFLHLAVDSNEWFYPGIFIPPTLQHLRVSTADLSFLDFKALCSKLPELTPVLHALELDFTQELDTRGLCEQSFLQLLAAFEKSLTCIKIPQHLATPNIYQALSRLPKLSDLMVNIVGNIEFDRTSPAKCVDGDGLFGSLQSLAFGGTPNVFHSVFIRRTLRFLTSLHLGLNPSNLDVVSFNAFVAAIVSGCPQLELLNIDTELPSALALSPGARLPNVPWSSVKPLLNCKKLESLLLPCFTVSMTIDQLTDLLTNRRNWRSLTVYTEQPLHLSDMLLFATYCPQLRTLGICIDPRAGLGQLPNVFPGIKFPFLREIEFGPSVVEPRHTTLVAQFLLHVCEDPPYLCGVYARFWDCVAIDIAEAYAQQHLTFGKYLTEYVQHYIDHHRFIAKTMKEEDSRMGFVDEDAEFYDVNGDAMDDDMCGSDDYEDEEDDGSDEEMLVDE